MSKVVLYCWRHSDSASVLLYLSLSTGNAHMVHIVNLIRLKMVYTSFARFQPPPPVRTPAFKSRIRPPYPQRVVKGDLSGAVI